MKQFYQQNYSNKNQITEKRKHSWITLKRPKKKFPHYILGIGIVSISLSDANIKILEI